jgi:hypothetical protein
VSDGKALFELIHASKHNKVYAGRQLRVQIRESNPQKSYFTFPHHSDRERPAPRQHSGGRGPRASSYEVGRLQKRWPSAREHGGVLVPVSRNGTADLSSDGMLSSASPVGSLASTYTATTAAPTPELASIPLVHPASVQLVHAGLPPPPHAPHTQYAIHPHAHAHLHFPAHPHPLSQPLSHQPHSAPHPHHSHQHPHAQVHTSHMIPASQPPAVHTPQHAGYFMPQPWMGMVHPYAYPMHFAPYPSYVLPSQQRTPGREGTPPAFPVGYQPPPSFYPYAPYPMVPAAPVMPVEQSAPETRPAPAPPLVPTSFVHGEHGLMPVYAPDALGQYMARANDAGPGAPWYRGWYAAPHPPREYPADLNIPVIGGAGPSRPGRGAPTMHRRASASMEELSNAGAPSAVVTSRSSPRISRV